MAVEFLHELKVPFFKVGSGDTNNFPYLEKTAKKGKTGVMDAFSELQQLIIHTNHPHCCLYQDVPWWCLAGCSLW